jgi:8-oxo-dGTP diphosphatase
VNGRPPDGEQAGEQEVRAAGGLVHRQAADGGVEVLLVHRPRYDDWSLPKGKAERDESDEDCARREVYEETGVRVELEEPIGSVHYYDRKGRPKVVHYWRMRPLSEADGFLPNDEVDRIRWCSVPEAMGLLSYDHDRDLVGAMSSP